MANVSTANTPSHLGLPVESAQTAVSWGPVLAGAFAAAGLSVLLLTLGSGLGLSSISPWPGQSASAVAIGVGAAIWLVIVHWLASALGGYIAGRLRVRWTNVHSDEVFFRDTSHGFLTWAVATVVTAAVVASAAGAIVGGAARTAGTLAGSAVQGAAQGAAQGATQNATADPSAYFADMLFRPGPAAAAAPAGGGSPAAGQTPGRDVRGEAVRILVRSVVTGEVPAGDRTYLAQAVQAETGLPQAEAEARVNTVLTQAKAAADQAKKVADDTRKAAATLALLTAFTMLIGAFAASVAAAMGGRERDDMELSSRPR